MPQGQPDEPTASGTYLAEEARSPARREYVGGAAYAMAGASNAHNQVATNILVALGGRLRGGPSRPFNSDTKVRIRLPSQMRFYYPDVMVTCRPNAPSDTFQDEPVLVVEVLSPETRRTDEIEKCAAYTTMPIAPRLPDGRARRAAGRGLASWRAGLRA